MAKDHEIDVYRAESDYAIIRARDVNAGALTRAIKTVVKSADCPALVQEPTRAGSGNNYMVAFKYQKLATSPLATAEGIAKAIKRAMS